MIVFPSGSELPIWIKQARSSVESGNSGLITMTGVVGGRSLGMIVKLTVASPQSSSGSVTRTVTRCSPTLRLSRVKVINPELIGGEALMSPSMLLNHSTSSSETSRSSVAVPTKVIWSSSMNSAPMRGCVTRMVGATLSANTSMGRPTSSVAPFESSTRAMMMYRPASRAATTLVLRPVWSGPVSPSSICKPAWFVLSAIQWMTSSSGSSSASETITTKVRPAPASTGIGSPSGSA